MNWLIPWEPSLTVCMAAAAAIAFWLRKEGLEKMFFGLGIAVIYFALQTHFDYFAEHSFLMHRVQQALLHHIGPLLLVLGGARLRCFGPIINTLLFCGLTLLWLIPHVHAIAMLDWRIYRLMNWGMVIDGLMFWTLALEARGALAGRVGMLLATIPFQVALGALLFFTPRELYPIYEICGRALNNLSPLMDQQLGALVIWLCGPMMSTIALLIILKREGLVFQRTIYGTR
jgi:putative membrane protein